MDVRATVERPANEGIKVHCLALGGIDLKSDAGKMTMQVIAVMAEFERALLIERTVAGLVEPRPQASHLAGLGHSPLPSKWRSLRSTV
jgi:putative DNA-invertase from lambdoid prophage Rac